MINLLGQQLIKTLIHLGNLLCVLCESRDNTLDFCNIEGLGWSIFVFLYTIKLLFFPLIEKNKSLRCGGVLAFIIGLLVIKRFKGSMLVFLSCLYSKTIIVS